MVSYQIILCPLWQEQNIGVFLGQHLSHPLLISLFHYKEAKYIVCGDIHQSSVNAVTLMTPLFMDKRQTVKK